MTPSTLRLQQEPNGSFTITGLTPETVADICANFTTALSAGQAPIAHAITHMVDVASSHPQTIPHLLSTCNENIKDMSVQLLELCILVVSFKKLSSQQAVKSDEKTDITSPTQGS